MLAIIHEMRSRHLPFLNGVFMTLNFGVSSLMLMMVGVLADKLGLNITYYIANFLAFLAIPLAFLIPRKKF
jgi:FSR family fosmidomycin resistance protein-like MFS transporter